MCSSGIAVAHSGRIELLQARLWLDGTRMGNCAKPLAKSTTLEAAVDLFVLEACPDREDTVLERVALGSADSTPADRTKAKGRKKRARRR